MRMRFDPSETVARSLWSTRLGEDPNRGVEAYDKRNTDRTWEILDVASRIAEAHGRPVPHVALAWLGGRPGITSTLLRARTVEQLESNMVSWYAPE